jgi:antitoxin CcdA
MASYSSSAAKRPVNLSVNEELLRYARESGINLSATLERALAEEVSRHRRERWLADNRDAIASYNRRVEEQGVFSDGVRQF